MRARNSEMQVYVIYLIVQFRPDLFLPRFVRADARKEISADASYLFSQSYCNARSFWAFGLARVNPFARKGLCLEDL